MSDTQTELELRMAAATEECAHLRKRLLGRRIQALHLTIALDDALSAWAAQMRGVRDDDGWTCDPLERLLVVLMEHGEWVDE